MRKPLVTFCMIVLAGMLFSPGTTLAQHTDKSNPPSGDSKKQGGDSSKQKSDMATGSGAQSLSSSDRRFVMEAAHSGMAEVDLGRLAVERAASDEVKQFAQRMVDDHSRANTELMELASRKGVTLTMDHSSPGSHGSASTTTDTTREAMAGTGGGTGMSGTGTSGTQPSDTQKDTAMAQGTGSHSGHDAKMMQKHKALVTKLSGLSGAEFDRAYMKQMVKDHSDAVSLFQREASRGNDAELKAWAAKTLPALQDHLRMAREISAKTGGSGDSASSKSNSGNK